MVLAHVPLLTFLDFNAICILSEWLVPLCCFFAELSLSRRVAKFPNPDAPGVPDSDRNWVLGAVAYIACWVLCIFSVFLGYEVLYSYYRRWRFREYSRL